MAPCWRGRRSGRRAAPEVADDRDSARDYFENLAPEYESCKRLARERAVPIKAVYEAALAAARRLPPT